MSRKFALKPLYNADAHRNAARQNNEGEKTLSYDGRMTVIYLITNPSVLFKRSPWAISSVEHSVAHIIINEYFTSMVIHKGMTENSGVKKGGSKIRSPEKHYCRLIL